MNNMIKTKKFDDLYELKCNPRYVIMLEKLVYAFANDKSNNQYNGGFWDSVLFSKDDISFWYFLLNTKEEFTFTNEIKNKDELVSAKCFSLLCFTFAINYMISYAYNDRSSKELVSELTYLYRTTTSNVNLILDENEVEIFYSIID